MYLGHMHYLFPVRDSVLDITVEIRIFLFCFVLRYEVFMVEDV